jgi:cytochrome c2
MMRPVLGLLALLLTGCETDAKPSLPGADAEAGRLLLEQYGCGTCHTIPGVRQAIATLGPPLTSMSRHVYIAGELPNDPQTLARFIQDPQRLVPGTGMPDLGVNDTHARDMVAYLYETH